MARKYAPPEGWALQAFEFVLDPDPKTWSVIRRQWGGRRHAHNWAVRTLKLDIQDWHLTGESTEKPSLYGLRKRWNQAKGIECMDRETGEVWWSEISKEAFSDGIDGAVDGYWRWQKSRAGNLEGKRVGFPKFKKKGKDRDRCSFTTGTM